MLWNIAFLVFVAFVLGLYGLVMLLRRKRLLAAAAALQGTFVTGAWWRPGKIAGENFTIELVRSRRTFRTDIQVRTLKTPDAWLLYARFFDPYPNWEFALVLGPHSERLFFTTVSFPRYAPAAGEKRDVLWRWLNRGSTDRRLPYEMLKEARITEIYIQDGRIAASFGGVVTKPARLQSALDVLQRLAAESGSG